MQLQNDKQTTVSDVIKCVKSMNFNEIEKIKNSLVEMDIYFKAHRKDNVQSVVNDFKENGYSDGFLSDLEQGLKKSSVYEN